MNPYREIDKKYTDNSSLYLLNLDDAKLYRTKYVLDVEAAGSRSVKNYYLYICGC